MTFERNALLTLGQRSAMATALGLVLATAACSGSGPDDAEATRPATESGSAQAPATAADDSSSETPGADSASASSGEMTIDGETHGFTTAYWCEPEGGYNDGTTVAIRLMATDDDNQASIYAIRVDENDGGESESRLRVATDPDTNFNSEGLDEEPTIVVEDGVVRLRGLVYRPGRDPVEVEAEFSLPAAPGFPGYC